MSAPLTWVRVERLPYGSTTFSESTAVQTDPDVLRVTCTDADYSAKHGPNIYRPGAWIKAEIIDQQGTVLQTIVSALGTSIDTARRNAAFADRSRVASCAGEAL